jgi:type 1 glutamine amidotransferase
MGQKTGAFTVDVSEDISMFEQENLEKYDAIVFNNTTGELFTPPKYKNMSVDEKKSADERSKLLKANLLNFVSSGKGIIGIHAATDCFYNWREFGQMWADISTVIHGERSL